MQQWRFMSKLERISAFISVVEENGFAAAARKKNLSTAAISRQVTNLEAELGVQLLQRTTRQISLTEIGLRYYQHCKQTLSELEEAEAAIASSKQEATGILRITSSRYFAVHYLLPRLPEFMAQNPKLRINFELAERFPDLAQEGIDVLVGMSMDGQQELVRKQIATSRYVICAAPCYLEKYGTPLVPADLTKHRYITHSMRNPDNVLIFKDGKEIYLEPILYLNDSRAILKSAMRGIGIAKLHDYVVADALCSGELVEILSDYQDPKIPIYLYYQQSRYLQPKIRHFIDFYPTLKENLRFSC